jgi:hypothetical protein
MRRKIEQRLDIKLKEDPFNKPQPNVGKSETPSGSGNYSESVNQFKTKLKAVPPKRGGTIFTGTGDITTQNIQGLLNSDPALISLGLKVNSANNIVTISDNDDVVIGTFDLSKAPPTNPKIREKYLEDLIDIVTNYSISKDPTSIGVSLMTGGQQSGAGGTSR